MGFGEWWLCASEVNALEFLIFLGGRGPFRLCGWVGGV